MSPVSSPISPLAEPLTVEPVFLALTPGQVRCVLKLIHGSVEIQSALKNWDLAEWMANLHEVIYAQAGEDVTG